MKYISTFSFWASLCISLPSILDFPHIPAIRRRLCGMALLGCWPALLLEQSFRKTAFTGLLWFFLGWSRNHFGLWYPSIIWWSHMMTSCDDHHVINLHGIALLLKYFCWLFGHWFIRRYTCFKLTRSCVVVRVTGLDRIVRPHYSLGWVHFGKKHSGPGLDFLPEVLTTFPFQAMVQNCLLHHPPYRVAEVDSLSASAKLSKKCDFGPKKTTLLAKVVKKESPKCTERGGVPV